MTESYTALGLTDEARRVASVLGHNYPSSEWYFDSYELVEKKPVERPPEAPDSRSWIRRQVDWLF
jgi:outer membrane protein assembly factor BamD